MSLGNAKPFAEAGANACPCFGDPAECMCTPNEAGLRLYIAGKGPAPMTPEQRKWCLSEIDRGTEYGYRREDYEAAPDAETAKAVLEVWVEYCRDKGLL